MVVLKYYSIFFSITLVHLSYSLNQGCLTVFLSHIFEQFSITPTHILERKKVLKNFSQNGKLDELKKNQSECFESQSVILSYQINLKTRKITEKII